MKHELPSPEWMSAGCLTRPTPHLSWSFSLFTSRRSAFSLTFTNDNKKREKWFSKTCFKLINVLFRSNRWGQGFLQTALRIHPNMNVRYKQLGLAASMSSALLHFPKSNLVMSVTTSWKPSLLLGKQKRCHGLAYPGFTTFGCKLYTRMREGKVQKVLVHVVICCEFTMISRGYCLFLQPKVFLPTVEM